MNFSSEMDSTIVDSVLQTMFNEEFSDAAGLLQSVQDVYEGEQQMEGLPMDGSNMITEIGSSSSSNNTNDNNLFDTETASLYNATSSMSPFFKENSVSIVTPSVSPNLELVSLQSQLSAAAATENAGKNPIVRVVSCHLVERQNNETWLLVPKPEVAGAAQNQFVLIPVPGGFQQQLLPALSAPTCSSSSHGNESGPSRSAPAAVEPAPYVLTTNLSTVEEMQALEEHVKKDAKNKKMLAEEFQGRGGTDSKNHMTRALSSLMKLELAGKYSWAGMIRNGEKKNNFKDLAVANILVESILHVHYNKKNIKKKNSARLKLENIIKEWLKRQGVASKKAGHC